MAERMTGRFCPCIDEKLEQYEQERRCSYCGRFVPLRTIEFNPEAKNALGEMGAWGPTEFDPEAPVLQCDK